MVQKSVLITGCSEGGIGDALAKEFHKKGLRVFATARNLAKVEHLKGMGLEILKLDVVDDVSIEQVVEEVKTRTDGTLDILVNNSGAGYNLPMLDSSVADEKKLFDLNVFALARSSTLGSIAGIVPLPWQGYYKASKAAVAVLSDNMRIEMTPWGVNVINVITGGVKTKFFENTLSQKLPTNSLYEPAREIIEPLLSGSFVEGKTMNVDSYAAVVVANALKSNLKVHFWAGNDIWMVWFAQTFGWSTIWDWVMPGFVNLPLVIEKIRAAEKSK